MNLVKAYITGFKNALQLPRMVLILYASNIFLALLLALPFFNSLNEAAGSGLLIKDMLHKPDYTIINELINNGGWPLFHLLKQTIWIALAYWILNVFFSGGIIKIFNKDKFTVSMFFTGAANHFFRFLALGVFMIILHIIFAALIYVSAYLIGDNFMLSADSELVFVRLALIALGIHFIIWCFLVMVSDYARYYLLLNNSVNIFKAVWKAVSFVFANIFKTYGLFLMILLASAAIFYLYYKILNDVGMATALGILIMFLIQQVVIILRIWFRVWILSSQYEMYSTYFIRSVKITLQHETYTDLDKKAAVLSQQMTDEDLKQKNAMELSTNNSSTSISEPIAENIIEPSINSASIDEKLIEDTKDKTENPDNTTELVTLEIEKNTISENSDTTNNVSFEITNKEMLSSTEQELLNLESSNNLIVNTEEEKIEIITEEELLSRIRKEENLK